MRANEYLEQLMKSYGLTSRGLADATGGVVAESTIRNHVALPHASPRSDKALAIARVFTVKQGAELLRLWGFKDLAESFTEGLEELPIRTEDGNALTYTGEKLTPSQVRKAREYIAFLQGR